MANIAFKLKSEEAFIELNKLLKITGLAQTGGHAKIMIKNGEVSLNGKPELQIRKKIREKDEVNCNEQIIRVTKDE